MNTPALRIALLMHSLNPRGGVVHTLELADALVQLGHHVTVIAAGHPGQMLFRSTAATLSIANLPMGNACADAQSLVDKVRARIQAVTEHLRTIDLNSFDVLHSQDSITANALTQMKCEGRIQRFARTVHHLDNFNEPQLATWQARGVQEAGQLMCVSALWQGILRQEWHRHADLVGNGVNLQRFQPARGTAQVEQDMQTLRRLGMCPDHPYWLAVGGIEQRKNTTRLLHAFAQLMHEAPSTRLVIAGGASLLEHTTARQAFEAARASHGMAAGQPFSDRLVLMGPLPDDVLPALYRQAIALVMPSVKEGFGLVAIEAMACGTPAIVSRIAPFTEHLGAQEVIFADPFDIDNLAQALRQSLDAHQHARVAGQARKVAARFDWMSSARRHLQIYQQHIHSHA
ncbi:MSMEG_0565 family glycosyltransferase [Aquabacterium sp.]|jgi:glycosyltransferase-like protein|uniref:MSMEG_0565 family glycosyltransferase n=1 Tax=Aquabacterium sp. TaxID=1872578 RepID=UPI0027BA34C5|nr:MSMEG_0565 family glycosyltransferase [Aquabacterium sp.]